MAVEGWRASLASLRAWEVCSLLSLPLVLSETVLLTLAGAQILLLLALLSTHTHADTAEEIMLQLGPPVRIPLRRAVESGSFSRWRCVGGLEDLQIFEHRSCLFENVCYDLGSADFLFYSRHPSNTSGMPALFDHKRGKQYKFRHRRSEGDPLDTDFLPLSKWVPYRERHSWSPRIVPGPLPASRHTMKGLTAFSAPFVPTNLGHVAWDEAFPLLVAMAQLGVYSPRMRLLRTHGCEALKPASRGVCAKFAAAFLQPLLGSRTDSILTLAQLRAQPTRGGLACFEKLLVGSAFDSFNSDALNDGKEPLLALYRARVLLWHGLSPGATPSRHTILLVRKEGKRAIANFKMVEAFVRKSYGHLAAVQTSAFSNLPMTEQVPDPSGALVVRSRLAEGSQ
ncbi:MAG: hypothetical protein SGPRY_006030 [Prymnesium sp.]